MKQIVFILILIIPNYIFGQFVNYDSFKAEQKTTQRPVIRATSNLLNQYDQKFVWIDVSVSIDTTDIAGSVSYILKSKTNIDTVYFEFTQYLTVDSVKINSQTVSYIQPNDSILIFPQSQILGNTDFIVKVFYHGASPNYPNKGLTKTWSDIYDYYVTWTLSESYHLKDWLPCKQDLNDRLDSAWIFVTVDTSLKAGSQGVLTNIVNVGNGKHRFEWKTKYPIVYYLLSLAVGDYFEYNIYTTPAGYSDSILIQNYIYNTPQCISDNLALIDVTGPLINLYSDKFGLYPWADEKYGHSMCPVGGGMEHQTMTSLGLFSTALVAHELAHQWFGDQITCSNWQDIWVNEGFASYAEYIFIENLISHSAADSNIVYCQNRAKLEPTGSIYVPFSDIWSEGRIFHHNLTYKKGSAFIHMIRYLCDNDSLFFTALKQLNIIYKDSVLTGLDVKHVFENISGKDFTDLFNQYYYGEGFPNYKFTWYQDSTAFGFSDLTIKLEQNGSSPNNPLFTTPLEIKVVYSDNSDTLVTINPNQAIQFFNILTKNARITNIVFNPNLWILANLISIEQEVEPLEYNPYLISIFPNPANEYLEFTFSGNNYFDGDFRLYDLAGREVLYFKLKNTKELIPIEKIKPGLYLAEVSGNHIQMTRKTVIVK